MVNVNPARATHPSWRAGLGVVVAAAALIMAAPATAGPSASSPGSLAVSASPLPADVLPGESALVVVTISNIGGSTLSGLTVAESLPAALAHVPGSTVAVRTPDSGLATVYSDAVPETTPVAAHLGALTPGLVVSAFDGIDLAPGDTLRVTFLVKVSAALAPGVTSLDFASLVTSGNVAASASSTLTILEEALAFAYDGGAD